MRKVIRLFTVTKKILEFFLLTFISKREKELKESFLLERDFFLKRIAI